MSKKVMLTKEQAQALEAALKKESADAILKTAAREYETWFNECHALNYMSLPTIAKALYAGYEIEPEQPKFYPGDKVIRISDGKMFTFRRKNDEFKYAWRTEEILVNIYEMDIRKPTPEEIYWLETLGRKKVGDFKAGDIFIDGEWKVELLEGHVGIDLAEEWYEKEDFKGLYPIESFKPFSQEEIK